MVTIRKLKEILSSRQDLERRDVLLLCLAACESGPASVRAMRDVALEAGYRKISAWKDISDVLDRSGGRAIRVPNGWELTPLGQQYIATLVGEEFMNVPNSSTKKNDRPIKILFLASNPAGTSPLRLDFEARAITDRLRSSPQGSRFEMLQEWAVRVSDLQASMMRHRPDIVHFSGHGNTTGEYVLEDATGRPLSVNSAALQNLFRLLGSSVKIVVFNSCLSSQQAAAVATVVPCVIGMDESVQDESAIAFASAFYQAIAFGQTIHNAFELGRNEIELSGLGQSHVPRLLVRDGIDPANFTLVA